LLTSTRYKDAKAITPENKEAKTEAHEIMRYTDHMMGELCVRYKGKSESSKYRRG
jgi:hypothetical protein